MISIVTTTRNSHQLYSWVLYHVRLGVDLLFVFIDDPSDTKSIDTCKMFPKNVVFFVCNDLFVTHQRNIVNSEYFNSYKQEVMSRQIINVLYILEHKREYNISWLINIDTDEVLHLKNGSRDLKGAFNILEENETYNIKLVNYELIPEHDSYNNCFLEGVYFKTDGYRYIAYANGKSCANVKKLNKCKLNGVHDFDTEQQQYTSPNIVILHFVSCNFSQFLQKYYDLGNFSDSWWSSIPISISFHTQARDKIVKCTKSEEECKRETRHFYDTHLLNNDKSDKILKIDSVRRLLME